MNYRKQFEKETGIKWKKGYVLHGDVKKLIKWLENKLKEKDKEIADLEKKNYNLMEYI